MITNILELLQRTQEPLDDEPRRVFMLVGLGNPGRLYRETRHNIGFMVIDAFANQHTIKLTKVQNKAIVGISIHAGNKVILVKPQTYMNLSGISVSTLVHFYKVPLNNLIVVHDDVDLPFGVTRIRPGGGSAGQKGIKSIIERLGTQNFPRLRMGIGRPPGQMESAAYVLQVFSKPDRELLDQFVDRAVDALDSFSVNGLETVMNRFNTTIQD